jgi:predicted transcriptional regulator
MLIYINFKFNFLTKYHSFILISNIINLVEEYESSHENVSQAIDNILVRFQSDIQTLAVTFSRKIIIIILQFASSCGLLFCLFAY